MSNVNKYKLLAEQCLELAEQAEDGPQERAALQEIAWRFAKLAYKAYFSEPDARNIQHTVRYTELAPDRFKSFWRGAEAVATDHD